MMASLNVMACHVVALVGLLGLVAGDLPVHCLHSETIGKWIFHKGAHNNDRSLTCGHELPDAVMTMVDDDVSFKNPNFKFVESYNVELKDPNIAVDEDGNEGTWTMVYDEGFEVVIDDKKFFSFFRYEPKTKFSNPDEVKDFNSFCGQTFSGWFHTVKDKEWGCYIGVKEGVEHPMVANQNNDNQTQDKGLRGKADSAEAASNAAEDLSPVDNAIDDAPADQSACPEECSAKLCPSYCPGGRSGSCCKAEDTESEDTESDVALSEDPHPSQTAIQSVSDAMQLTDNDGLSTSNGQLDYPQFRRTGAHLMAAQHEGKARHHRTTASTKRRRANDQLWTPDTAFIETVNGHPHNTWKAENNEGAFKGLKVTDMMKMLGSSKYNKPRSARAVTSKEVPKDFPKSWDWREIDGGKYMTDVIEQGSCGSCYAIAATDAANMKVKIASKGRTDPDLSMQNAVSCSDYNQGCEGGYPLLVAKFAEDLGWVPTRCQEYHASDEECQKDCYDSPDNVYQASDYEYIGGYYGACNEADMMAALKVSPIVVALNAPPDLFYYGDGVYHAPLSHTADTYDLHGDSRWEKTNHAVVAVGWGEEDHPEDHPDAGQPLKYWVIKNSWGESWGDNGYFKMKRGSDDVAIESMAVNFKVVMPDGRVAE